MSLTREEVIENELLSEGVIDEVPEYCECGAPIEFTDTVKQAYCSNPKCLYKVATRLEKMAKAMDVDGFGSELCLKLCKEYKLISPFQIFLLQGRNVGVSGAYNKIEAMCNSEKRDARLWELVKYAGIPGIEQISLKIFGGYNSIAEAYKDIEEGQVAFIANKLGIKKTESVVMAVNVYNNLVSYKEELEFGEKQFRILAETGDRMMIAITDGVVGFTNKSEFVKYLNKRYDRINVVLANNVSSNVEALVCDGYPGSNKHRTAERLNAKCVDKAITSGKYTSDDIGKRAHGSFHPVGEEVFICTHEELIERLDAFLSEIESTESKSAEEEVNEA